MRPRIRTTDAHASSGFGGSGSPRPGTSRPYRMSPNPLIHQSRSGVREKPSRSYSRWAAIIAGSVDNTTRRRPRSAARVSQAAIRARPAPDRRARQHREHADLELPGRAMLARGGSRPRSPRPPGARRPRRAGQWPGRSGFRRRAGSARSPATVQSGAPAFSDVDLFDDRPHDVGVGGGRLADVHPSIVRMDRCALDWPSVAAD